MKTDDDRVSAFL